MRPRLAIFGGTFDPIHTAHLTVAREAVVQYGLSAVLFVVAARPPHKTGSGARQLCPSHADGGTGLRPDAGVHAPSRGGRRDQLLDPDHPESEGDGGAGRGGLLPDRGGRLRGDPDLAPVERRGPRGQPSSWSPGPATTTAPPGATVFRLDTVAMPVSSSEIRARLAAGRDRPRSPGRHAVHPGQWLYGYPRR